MSNGKEEEDDGRIDQQNHGKNGIAARAGERCSRDSPGILDARLPASIAGNLDSILSGGAATEAGGAMLGSAAAKLGSMFGKDQ